MSFASLIASRNPRRRPTVTRTTTAPGESYRPALDGLRTVSVAAVLCYHMDAAQGGYLGVDVFFVLSGFLISSLLLDELARSGGVALAAFYQRRAVRLLPAFYVYLACGLALVLLFKGPSQQHLFYQGAVASLLFVNNWLKAVRPASGGSWLGHVWSLSVEEQFYLLWPILLLALARSRVARNRLSAAILTLVSLSVLGQLLLVGTGASEPRIYFGADTRATELLIGCALAAWQHGHAGEAHARLTSGLGRLGLPAFIALGVLVVIAPPLGRLSWFDWGGFAFVGALAALVIVGADKRPDLRWVRLLGSRPMSWLGRRSYAFYLWHFPVTSVAHANLRGRIGTPLATVIAATISVGLAALSHRMVEAPIRRRYKSHLASRPRVNTTNPSSQ
jgi:peptidoglycan/LPS O-acetylase OafA/YrhL